MSVSPGPDDPVADVPLLLPSAPAEPSVVQDQRFDGTEADSDRMEQQDSVVKMEVKIEIDIAEELPQSWHMTEKHPHDSVPQSIKCERDALHCAILPEAMKEKRADLAAAVNVHEDNDSQHTLVTNVHLSDRKDVNTENTASLPVEHTSDSQAAPCDYSGFWVKQEVSILQMGQTSDTQTSDGCCDNICLEQEVAEDQCKKKKTLQTDVKAGEVGSIMSCQEGVRHVDEALNCINIEKTDVQPFTTGQPTDNNTQVTTSGDCSESGKGSSTGKEFSDDNCLNGFYIDVWNISTCNAKKAKPFACHQCGAKFNQSRHLLQHILKHTGQKPHVCQQCDAKFSGSSNLKRHMLIHTGQKPYACEQCDAKFTRSSHLKEHMLIHSGQKPHACQHCDAKFTHSSHLKRHILIHTGQKRHACQECDAKFAHSHDLKRHMLLHTGQKPHACQQCDAKFTHSSALQKHMVIHTGQKPHACQHCDAKFIQSYDLKRHLLIHTGQKPHACEQCDAKFTRSHDLKRHILTHTGQKPYACEQCGAKFTQSGHLKEHTLIHSGQKPHVCQHCDAKFTLSSYLKRHIFNIHREETSS